jgi:hypothetical protein
MDFQELTSQLKELGVTPKDILRASLYLDFLIQVKNYFLTIKELLKPIDSWWGAPKEAPGWNFVKNALLSPNLLNELGEVLDFFVAPAVAADLQRASAANPGWSCRDYFDHVILDKDTTKYLRNLKAFRTTYPITHHALGQLSDNFRTNIVQMCLRVFNDRDLLIAFYNDLYNHSLNIVSLEHIKPTGSDFHKGGAQVLILTFFIIYKKDSRTTRGKLRVVYKPSDLEIDCLIAGDSKAINRVQPGFMDKSLFEIYNFRLAEWQRQDPTHKLLYGERLDTYRILPRIFTSLLEPNQYPLPIRKAYGYIQYLNHKLLLSPRRMLTFSALEEDELLKVFEVGTSDYLIFANDKKKEKIINTFYYKSGAFAALACTFSLLDMHCGNVRVMEYRPYFIDLETSLTKKVNDIRDTDLLAYTASGHNIGGINGLFNEEKSGWVIKKAFKASSQREEWSIKEDYLGKYFQNRLWSNSPVKISAPPGVKGSAASGIKTAIPVKETALLGGFAIGMTILSECQKNDDFASWFKRIQNVVVRYLVAGTGMLEEVRNKCFLGDITGAKQLLPTLEGLLQNEYTKLSNAYSKGDNPDFIWPALEQTKRDFLTLDIPVFYHRIGTSEIVDSLGNRVILPHNLNIPRNTFFSSGPTEGNVIRGQVQILGEEGLPDRLRTIQKTMKDVMSTSLVNDKMVTGKLFRPIKRQGL